MSESDYYNLRKAVSDDLAAHPERNAQLDQEHAALEKERKGVLAIIDRKPRTEIVEIKEMGGGLETRQAQTILGALEQAGLTQLKKGAPIEEVEQALRKLAASANGVDPLRRAVLRNAVIESLEKIQISAPARLVDAILKEPRSEGGNGQGQEILFADPEPWADPVDGNQLAREIGALFERFVILPKGGATALSLWALHTHAFEATRTAPILALLSPERRCGKTVTLGILSELVGRPLPASNISPAAVYRTVEKFQPTLLIDEADSFLAGNEEMRGILNSGHPRATAFVIRTVGNEFEPRRFSTWSAKSIAQIGKLPATLDDRSIVLPMKRKTPGERVERFRPEKVSAALEVIRRKAVRWAADSLETLRESDPTIPEVLNDRAQDNWRPLLAIADTAGGSWPQIARQAALLLSGPGVAEENSGGVQLLWDLRDFFQKTKQDFLSSEDVVEKLLEMEERRWGEWKKGKPITKIQVAAILRKFRVRPKQCRLGSDPVRGYELTDLQDPFARYLASDSVQSVQINEINGLGDVSGSVQTPPCTDPEVHPNPLITKACTGRTDLNPPLGTNLRIKPPRMVQTPSPWSLKVRRGMPRTKTKKPEQATWRTWIYDRPTSAR